jgi:geranylgeranyl diphosphate synthase type II
MRKKMDVVKYLIDRKALIDGTLDDYVPSKDEVPERIHQSIRYSLFSGGKRLRPIFTLAILDLFQRPLEWGFPAGCALEMIHTCSLILDDLPCMDDASMRRGKPANHLAFGEDVAILSAMALLNLAHGILAEDDIGGVGQEDVRMKVIDVVSRAVGTGGIIGGQTVDLACRGKALDFETLLYIHSRKTTPLFSAALEAGGLIAGADRSAMKHILRYGKNCGLAFQIIDDLLDVTGNRDELGKDVNTDDCRTTFASYLGLEHSRELAEELITTATAAIRYFGSKSEPLVELARFILHRNM